MWLAKIRHDYIFPWPVSTDVDNASKFRIKHPRATQVRPASRRVASRRRDARLFAKENTGWKSYARSRLVNNTVARTSNNNSRFTSTGRFGLGYEITDDLVQPTLIRSFLARRERRVSRAVMVSENENRAALWNSFASLFRRSTNRYRVRILTINTTRRRPKSRTDRKSASNEREDRASGMSNNTKLHTLERIRGAE